MPNQTIAVVTGASSGLGKEFVKLLLRERNLHEIWAIARNQQKLDRLRDRFGPKIRPFSIDLSDTAAIAGFGKTLAQAAPNIRYLVNNAGYAKFCSYRELGVEESVNMISLNCSGVVAMGLVCLPWMRAGSHILNISSQASFQPLPYQNIYSATKAFVRNYSRALHVELKEKGVSVTSVCPGWMDTGLYQRAEIGAPKATRRFYGMVEPAKVAAKALCDAKRGRDISVYGLYVKSGHLLAKLLPQRAMMQLWLWQQGLS